VTSQFLTNYAQDSPAALAELVNMVIRSAGCSIQVTEDDVNDTENVEGKLADLQEAFQAVRNLTVMKYGNIGLIHAQQNVSDYPLISRAKSSHAFHEALISFFDELVRQMGTSGIMYDDVALIENIHLWFATMSSSTSRPFRHTATVVSLAVTSAMCMRARNEATVAADTRALFEGEKKKKGGNKARLADFENKIAASENKTEFLAEKIGDFFDTVYVHRYRDVDPKIRIECVDALATWIQTLPAVFFEGQYLRYMGWMLSDTHAPMREEVVKQLSEIMKDKKNHGGMRHFMERFRPRIIEIATQDAEALVRSFAVDLADQIRQAGMLEPDDIDMIGKLIYDTEPKVRRAVVEFFIEGVSEVYDSKVEELAEDLDDILDVDTDDLESPRKEWIKFKALVEVLSSYDTEDQDEMPSQILRSADSEFLNVAGVESRFTLAAHALYEKMAEIKDWDMLASYLLFDHSAKPSGSKPLRAIKAAFKPTDREEVILLEMLNAVVKLGIAQVQDQEKSKKKGARGDGSATNESTARRLASLIPRLLKKFGADPKTATVVLRLEHILNLGVFQELRQDSTAYAKLLDDISAQFNSHADRSVLSEASAALLHARGFEELEEVTDVKIQSLWDDSISVLRKLNKSGEIGIRRSFREPVLLDLSHNVARIDKLASISNCVEPLESTSGRNSPLPISILLDIIGRGVFEEDDPEIDALEDEVVLSAIKSAMFYFMWKVRSLREPGEIVSDVDIDQIKDLQDTFITNLIASLSSRATLDPVRLFATGTFLDLHVLFSTLRTSRKSHSNGASSHNDYLQTTIKEIAPEVQTELTSIFDAAEKQFAKKSKKKLAEPGEDEAPEDLDSEPEDEGDDEDATDHERWSETLKAEQQLCELTSKLVLAILAKVIDASGPLKGKLFTRIQRNRSKLGPNFREVIAYLDEPKPKGKRSRAQPTAKKPQSREIVEEEEEDEDDPFAEDIPEEGTAEDLRRRELLDEDPPLSVDDEAPNVEEDEEDDILGD
jgi:cohesin complex subunit SA-1/2